MEAPRLSRRASLLAVAGGVLAGCEGDPAPPPPRQPGLKPVSTEPILRLGGTGAMIPLMRNLVRAWRATEQGRRWRVELEPGVRSGGGMRAAYDGELDLGLMSRPLTEAERAMGMTITTVARGAVALAVRRELPLVGLSRAELVALYSGEPIMVGESRLILLLRDREESANSSLERLFPELRPLREMAYRQRRARVLYHDEAMREAVASIPNGIGLVDLEAVLDPRGTLRGVPIDGVEPSIQALESGLWRATRDLMFAHRPEREDRVRDLIAFATSPASHPIYTASGCVPVGSA